jgi:hypothetical protein
MDELAYTCLEFNLRPYFLSAILFHSAGIAIAVTGLLVAGLPSFRR